MHKFRIEDKLKRVLDKLLKKDRNLYEQIRKKINEIINSYDIEHYKNLRYNMKDSKRVHIGHFVLVFNFDKTQDLVSFIDFDHHDNIYQKK